MTRPVTTLLACNLTTGRSRCEKWYREETEGTWTTDGGTDGGREVKEEAAFTVVPCGLIGAWIGPGWPRELSTARFPVCVVVVLVATLSMRW